MTSDRLMWRSTASCIGPYPHRGRQAVLALSASQTYPYSAPACSGGPTFEGRDEIRERGHLR